MGYSLEEPITECVVTSENNIVYRKTYYAKENPGEIYSFGPGSLHGEFNTYRMVNEHHIKDLPNYKSNLKFLDFVNDKTLSNNTKLIKGHVWGDPFNFVGMFSLQNLVNPVYTGLYLDGPENIMDFYFTLKNEEEYKFWETSQGLQSLYLPNGFEEFGYCIRIDTEIKKIILYKRYGTSLKMNLKAHEKPVNLADGSIFVP